MNLGTNDFFLNRFDFRTGFTVSYYDDNGNNKTTQLKINGYFSVDCGGAGVCIHGDIIEEALDELNPTDHERTTIVDFIKANYCCNDGYWLIDNIDYLDQGTGLRDKNDKPIFEGDWLKTKDGSYCYVVWFDGFWWVKSLPSEAMDFEHARFYRDCEVVGNIHDNPDFMEKLNEK